MTKTLMDRSVADRARAFQALADEKRIRILRLLADGERCVCELTDALGAGQSLLSFHLKTLKESGLVSDRREGRWVYYSLVPEALADLEAAVQDLGRGAGEGRACGC
jgi:ArsR family transcriptional regulator